MATYNSEMLTVAGTSVGFTASKLINSTGQRCNYVFATCETAEIRFWVDGSDPDSTHGHLVEVGDSIELDDPDEIKNFRAIRTGSSGALAVQYSVKSSRFPMG